MKLEFSPTDLKENKSNFMKIRPVGAVLFHANRQTDRRDEANSRFQHLCGRT
jgi:hypothetical protein